MKNVTFPIYYGNHDPNQKFEMLTIAGNDINGEPVNCKIQVPKTQDITAKVPKVMSPITYIDKDKEVIALVPNSYIGQDPSGNIAFVESYKPVYREVIDPNLMANSEIIDTAACHSDIHDEHSQESLNGINRVIESQIPITNNPEEKLQKPAINVNFGNNLQPNLYGSSEVINAYQKKSTIDTALKSPKDYADFIYTHCCFKVDVNTEEIYIFYNTYFKKITYANFQRYVNLICDTYGVELKSAKIIEDICKYILKDYRIAIHSVKNDRQYIAFKDKILNLESMIAYIGTPNVFLTWCLNCNYDDVFNKGIALPYPNNFCKFLDEIADRDPELIARLWEAIGLLLSNDVSSKKIILFQGIGNSGKSKLAEFIISLMSENAVTELTFSDLNEKFALSGIPGKHMICSMDIPYQAISDQAASKLKSISSGGTDKISVEPKYQNRYDYQPEVQCLFGTNHKLNFKINDDNFMKRFVAIPFNVKISDDQIDPKLLNKFKFETCAIIYQALRAYINLKNNHYRFSGNFKLNGNSSSLTCNDGEHFIDEFINQNCIFNPDEFCSTNALFIEYCKFIKTFKLYCNIDIKGFSRKFKEICGTKIKDGKRNCSDLKNSGNGFWGVTLKTS